MSSEATTGPRDLCRAHTSGPHFQATSRTRPRRMTKAKWWRAARRAPSSFTTGLYGTDILQTRPASPAARFKAHTSVVRRGREATYPPACAPKLLAASARSRGIYWPSDWTARGTLPGELLLMKVAAYQAP